MSTSSDTSTPSTTALTTTPTFAQRLSSVVGGDIGIVPVLIALVALIIYFEARTSVFLGANNVTNLFIQAVAYVLLGMAELWLLLLGEIDLSLGWVAGLAGSIAAIYTNIQYGWPWWLAFLAALAAATAIGAVWGVLVVKLKLPSFIVTLAGSFVVQGVLLYILGKVFEGGGARVESSVLANLTQGDLSPTWTWILVIGALVISAGYMFGRERARRVAGLAVKANWRLIVKLSFFAIISLLLVWRFNSNRGVFGVVTAGMPVAIPIVGAIVLVYSFILARTKFGRFMYAIGGNMEAARRAGIPVGRYRIYAFMLGGLTAGMGGLFYVSFLGSYSTSSTDPSLVLYGVAAAVIGGASLYGGRGKMTHPLIGGIIVAVIYNGLTLIQVSPDMEYVVIGAVLLAAVVIDSLARRSQTLIK